MGLTLTKVDDDMKGAATAISSTDFKRLYESVQTTLRPVAHGRYVHAVVTTSLQYTSLYSTPLCTRLLSTVVLAQSQRRQRQSAMANSTLGDHTSRATRACAWIRPSAGATHLTRRTSATVLLSSQSTDEPFGSNSQSEERNSQSWPTRPSCSITKSASSPLCVSIASPSLASTCRKRR